MVFKRMKWLPYLLLYLLLYFYHFAVSKYPGDDFIFSEASKGTNIAVWLMTRYQQWSGRIFPDAMVIVFLRNLVWLWRLLNPLAMMLLAYGLVRIWKKKVSFLELLAALAIVGYFKENVLSSGVFWITGSFNYLWPISLGLLAMIPYADLVFRQERLSNSYQYILTLIIGFLASIGNEQVALCMSCFAVLAHLELFRQKGGQDKKLILLTFVIIIGTSLLLLAPGNQIRWVKEAAYWYPGFENLSLKDHFYLGTIWGFAKLFQDMRNLVLLLSGIAIIVSLKDKKMKSNKVFKLFTLLFTISLLLLITEIGVQQLYGFEKIKNFRFSSMLISFSFLNKSFIMAIFPYLYWVVYSFMLVYLLLKNSKHRLLELFVFLAVIATLVVMFFSPTIYGSGNRVLTVGSVLTGLVLVGKMVENKLICSFFALSILACWPVINFVHMLTIWLSKGFNPFL